MVTIGKVAVIAAGVVATKNVEQYAIMGGIPTKKNGERFKNLDYVPSEHRLPFM